MESKNQVIATLRSVLSWITSGKGRSILIFGAAILTLAALFFFPGCTVQKILVTPDSRQLNAKQSTSSDSKINASLLGSDTTKVGADIHVSTGSQQSLEKTPATPEESTSTEFSLTAPRHSVKYNPVGLMALLGFPRSKRKQRPISLSTLRSTFRKIRLLLQSIHHPELVRRSLDLPNLLYTSKDGKVRLYPIEALTMQSHATSSTNWTPAESIAAARTTPQLSAENSRILSGLNKSDRRLFLTIENILNS